MTYIKSPFDLYQNIKGYKKDTRRIGDYFGVSAPRKDL